MSQTLALEADLTVMAVADLKSRLLAALQADADVVLDASAVSEVDGAGLQLLLAAQKQALAQGGRLLLQPLSPVMSEALSLIDLGPELCAPLAEETA